MCTTHISRRRRLLDRPLLRLRIFFSLSLFRKMNFIQTLHEANEMFEFLGIHSDTDRYICIGAGTQIITGITHSMTFPNILPVYWLRQICLPILFAAADWVLIITKSLTPTAVQPLDKKKKKKHRQTLHSTEVTLLYISNTIPIRRQTSSTIK